MALESTLFRDDAALQACLTNDRAHLTRGASGEHVAKVQFALFAIDGLGIDEGEIARKTYGPSTAAAVLAYKTRRSIINRAYQSTPDDIVGKMTIAALDREMLSKQGQSAPKQFCLCGGDPLSMLGRTASALPPVEAIGVGAQQVGIRGLVGDTPSASLPHEIALARVGVAALAITQTRAVLAGLISFRPIGSPLLPAGIMALFDKVWRNFGLPTPLPISSLGEFPLINTRTEFLSAIDSHYALMQSVLAQASSLFRTMKQDVLGKSTFALTLVNPRVSGDPPGFQDGLYFGELFAKSSPNKQIEIVVHEASHFKDGHNFNDSFSADSENWGKFQGGDGILNAWSYSMFVLDVVFNRTTPFPH